jgi:hypothetical protein
MKAIYDSMPDAFQAIGNGSVYFRWDIAPTIVNIEGVSVTKYQCEEALVWNTLTREKITEAVIAEMYPDSVEKKLINDYLAAKEGILGQDRIDAYKAFITDRDRLKSLVSDECAQQGVV